MGSADSAFSVRAAAALVFAGALLSGPLAMVVVSRVAPQGAWLGVDSFVEHYHPIQTVAYLVGYLLLTGFILFTAACHSNASPALRIRRRAALVRRLLVTNGVLSILGAACTALYDRWVFSAAGLASFAAWNLLIAACFALIALTPNGGRYTG